MSDTKLIETERLILRRWRESDLPVFAELNADPEVMQHFPSTLTRAESDALVERLDAHIASTGHGFWAAEVKGGDPFIGFVGIKQLAGLVAPFMPATEIGWRLRRHTWGRGYASEGARASIRYGFDTLGLAEIVSMTAVGNLRSRAVMERMNMSHHPRDDFDHPSVPEGHPARRHVLYRLSRG